MAPGVQSAVKVKGDNPQHMLVASQKSVPFSSLPLPHVALLFRLAAFHIKPISVLPAEAARSGKGAERVGLLGEPLLPAASFHHPSPITSVS